MSDTECFGKRFLQIKECKGCMTLQSCKREYQKRYGKTWEKKKIMTMFEANSRNYG